MQFLTTVSLLSLAAYVAADQSFQLNAKGKSINSQVTFSDNKVTLENGDVATINLEEPSGYAGVSGKYLENSENGIVLADKGDSSKDWGVSDGVFRFAAGGSDSFYACPASKGYTLQTYTCDGGEEVTLTPSSGESTSSTSAVAPSSSAAAPTSSVASTSKVSSAPIVSSSGYSNVTTATLVTSTLVTITKCPETVTNCPLDSTVTTLVPTTITTTYCPASETPFISTSKASVAAHSTTLSTKGGNSTTPTSSHPGVTSEYENGANNMKIGGAAGALAAIAAMLM